MKVEGIVVLNWSEQIWGKKNKNNSYNGKSNLTNLKPNVLSEHLYLLYLYAM